MALTCTKNYYFYVTKFWLLLVNFGSLCNHRWILRKSIYPISCKDLIRIERAPLNIFNLSNSFRPTWMLCDKVRFVIQWVWWLIFHGSTSQLYATSFLQDHVTNTINRWIIHKADDLIAILFGIAHSLLNMTKRQ